MVQVIAKLFNDQQGDSITSRMGEIVTFNSSTVEQAQRFAAEFERRGNFMVESVMRAIGSTRVEYIVRA